MASVSTNKRFSSFGWSVNGANGVNGINGASSSATSSPVTTKSTSWSYKSSSANGGVTDSSAMNLVRSTAQMLEKRGTAELGYGVMDSVSRTTFIELVQYIGNERLSSLPHKGSKW